MIIKTEYQKSDNIYIAYIDDDKMHLGSGGNIEQAIGSLIRSFPWIFGIKIEYLI